VDTGVGALIAICVSISLPRSDERAKSAHQSVA
jgi:uncharacterized membrane protein YgaE (UPF0421/DUF939 family)